MLRNDKRLSFAQYITHLKKLRDDVCDILGQEEIKCLHCNHVEHRKHKIPEYMWHYLIVKTCDTSLEEKRMMLHWHHAYSDSKKLVELLLKLDATHDIDVSAVAHGPEYKTNMSNFANHAYTSSDHNVGHNHESLPSSQRYMPHDLQGMIQFCRFLVTCSLQKPLISITWTSKMKVQKKKWKLMMTLNGRRSS